MTHLDKVLYTAKTHSTGGRDGGASRTSVAIWTSSFRLLAPRASVPTRSNCSPSPLVGLLRKSDRACGPQKKSRLPADVAIDAEVDLNLADGGYFLRTRLTLPGVEREAAEALVDEAHEICPYSRATRGNIEVAIKRV